jgi:hypothetical protein
MIQIQLKRADEVVAGEIIRMERNVGFAIIPSWSSVMGVEAGPENGMAVKLTVVRPATSEGQVVASPRPGAVAMRGVTVCAFDLVECQVRV